MNKADKEAEAAGQCLGMILMIVVFLLVPMYCLDSEGDKQIQRLEIELLEVQIEELRLKNELRGKS